MRSTVVAQVVVASVLVAAIPASQVQGDDIYMTDTCPQTVHLGPLHAAAPHAANLSKGFIYGARSDYTTSPATRCDLHVNVTGAHYRVTVTLRGVHFCRRDDAVKIYDRILDEAVSSSLAPVVTITSETRAATVTSAGRGLTISLTRGECAKTSADQVYRGVTLQYFVSDHTNNTAGELSSATIAGIAVACVVGTALLLLLIWCGAQLVKRTSSNITPVFRISGRGGGKRSGPGADNPAATTDDNPMTVIEGGTWAPEWGGGPLQKHHLRQSTDLGTTDL